MTGRPLTPWAWKTSGFSHKRDCFFRTFRLYVVYMWPHLKPAHRSPAEKPRPTVKRPEPPSTAQLDALLECWADLYSHQRSELEARLLKLREQAARLAPRGSLPEQNISPELRALAEQYREHETALDQLREEDRLLQQQLASALQGAQELDRRLEVRRSELQQNLAESRADLCNRPERVMDIEPQISLLKKQLRMIDESVAHLHNCTWDRLRVPLTELNESSWSMQDLGSFALGQDPMFGDAGVVGQLEHLFKRTEHLGGSELLLKLPSSQA